MCIRDRVLLANTNQGVIEIGESTVTNGVFEFTGRMPDVTVVYLAPVKKEPILATFVLENANYTITMGTNELIVESDGAAQKVWKEFYELEKFLLQNQQRLEMQARANPSQLQRLQQEFSKIEDKVQADELALIKKHNDSPVSALVVASKLAATFDDAALKERYEALGEKMCIRDSTLFLGNVHIYENNIPGTRALLAGDETVRFGLNV